MALIGHWPLNNNLNDYSGLDNNISTSTELQTTHGKLGKSYLYPHNIKINDITKITNNIDKSFSFSFWYFESNSPSDNATNPIYGATRDASGTSGMGINIGFVDTNGLFVKIHSSSNKKYDLRFDNDNSTLRLNKWRHYAMTYDLNKAVMYIDGVKICEKYANLDNMSFSDVDNIYIGNWITNTNTIGSYKLNDLRIYSHILTDIEIKDIYNLKIIHYNMEKTPFSYENIIKDQTKLFIYNNNGIPSTITTMDYTLFDSPVYKITFTPETQEHVERLRNSSLHAKGVYFNIRTTLKANTKYNYSIYFKRITETITSFGGTASNIGGWKCKDDKIIDNNWYRSNQYRDGTTNEDKTDYIFTSIVDPHADIGRKTEFLVSSQMLVEGTTQRLDFTNDIYTGRFEDISGFGNHSNVIQDIKDIRFEYINENKYPYIDVSYNNNITLFTSNNPLFGQSSVQEFTLSAWVNSNICEGNSSFVNLNHGIYFSYASRHKAINYLNSGADDYYMYSSYIDKYVNTWTHYTFRFKNNGVDIRDIFINGKKSNSEGPNRTNTPSGLNSVISFLHSFKGKISDIRMYATALDDSSITSIYRERSHLYGDKINRYLKMENGTKVEYVKLLKDRDYYKKLRLNLPKLSEFYIENDLTDRVNGIIPTDYENCNSLSGYTKGGSKLCVQKQHDGLLITRPFGNIMKDELIDWNIFAGHSGSIVKYSPYHFKYNCDISGKQYVISDGYLNNLNSSSDKARFSFKYKATKGIQFGIKLHGLAWIQGQTSYTEISSGEWTTLNIVIYPTGTIPQNSKKISFECTSQQPNWTLEVKDIMVQYGEDSEFYGFTEVNQMENGRLEYPIPNCVKQNNYVLCMTFNGYNMSTEYGNIITFNENFADSSSRNIYTTKSNLDFDVNNDINIISIRHDTYKKWFVHQNGVLEEIDTGLSTNSRFTNWLLFKDSPFGEKMNILTDGLNTHMVNSKLKNLYIGKFIGTEWEQNGVLNNEYLFKVLMNNCYFDSMDIGETRLVQNSIVKTNDSCSFDVFPDMTLEIVDG